MTVQLTREVIDLFADQETVKILATTDDKGFPHAVIKQSLQLGEDGNLVYLELLESSQTYKNLLRSIWFKGKAAVTLKGKDGQSYQIKGKPIKVLNSGTVFQKYYLAIREKLGDVDLAAVWIIKPEEVINETFLVKKSEEERLHPYFVHLDRLAKYS